MREFGFLNTHLQKRVIEFRFEWIKCFLLEKSAKRQRIEEEQQELSIQNGTSDNNTHMEIEQASAFYSSVY